MNNHTFSTFESTYSLPNLVKRTSVKSVFASVAFLTLGLLLFGLVFSLHDSSSTISMALLVLAAVFVLYGTFCLFWHTKKLYYQPTGSEIKEYFMFFDLKDLQQLRASITEGNFDVSPAFRCKPGGNIRLHTLITSDNQFAAVQLYQFVPYTYSPVTSVYCFKESTAVAFSTFINKCRK